MGLFERKREIKKKEVKEGKTGCEKDSREMSHKVFLESKGSKHMCVMQANENPPPIPVNRKDVGTYKLRLNQRFARHCLGFCMLYPRRRRVGFGLGQAMPDGIYQQTPKPLPTFPQADPAHP